MNDRKVSLKMLKSAGVTVNVTVGELLALMVTLRRSKTIDGVDTATICTPEGLNDEILTVSSKETTICAVFRLKENPEGTGGVVSAVNDKAWTSKSEFKGFPFMS